MLLQQLKAGNLVRVEKDVFNAFWDQRLALPDFEYTIIHRNHGLKLYTETRFKDTVGFGWDGRGGYFLNPYIYSEFTTCEVIIGPWQNDNNKDRLERKA